MKKIFYTVALSMFLTINVFANDNVIDLTEAGLSKIDLSQVEMPTESEIKKIIDKYNFSSEQKEQIYKDTYGVASIEERVRFHLENNSKA